MTKWEAITGNEERIVQRQSGKRSGIWDILSLALAVFGL